MFIRTFDVLFNHRIAHRLNFSQGDCRFRWFKRSSWRSTSENLFYDTPDNLAETVAKKRNEHSKRVDEVALIGIRQGCRLPPEDI